MLLTRIVRWLKSMFRPRDRLAGRGIFVVWDGTKSRRLDPLVCLRTIGRECPEYEQHLRTLAEAVPESAVADEAKAQRDRATVELVAAARAAFGLKPLDDAGGLTDAEALGAFAAFLRFMAAPTAPAPSPA